MEDAGMCKKYYWIIDGKYYEVSKETYQKFKREYDHARMLQRYENEVYVFSLDAMATEETTGYDVIADLGVNVEESAVHNLMIEKLRDTMKKLDDEELDLIKQIYVDEKTQREIAAELGISQNAVNKRKIKLLNKLRKFLES